MTRSSPLAMLVLMMAGCMLGCGGSGATSETTTPAASSSGNDASANNASANNGGSRSGTETYIARGMAMLEERRCEEAIRLGFDPAIAEFERGFRPGTRVIGSRVTTDGAGPGAVVIDAAYSDAIYMRAYCLVELGRVPEAAQALQRALEIIPDDVAYACELGNIMQERHEWAPSLDIYRRALVNVEALDGTGMFNPSFEHPTGVPILGLTLSDWRRRAMRGIGFSLIEVGDLDGAEAMFRRVLEIDPSDARALNELAFIAERRGAAP